MDNGLFDRLTRRFVLGGLAGGPLVALLGFDGAKSKKRKKNPSKRQRCRKQERIFCAERCCPRS